MPIHPPLPHEAEHLVPNVVRSLSSAHLRKRRARRRAFWGVLAGIFAVGSHSAAAIARSCGYDPDSGERVVPLAVAAPSGSAPRSRRRPVVDPLSVPCPTCGGWPGVPCSKCKRDGCACGGAEFHAARVRAAEAEAKEKK